MKEDELVSVPFTYAIYFFLCDQNAGTYPYTLVYSFFFVPPKKKHVRVRGHPYNPHIIL